MEGWGIKRTKRNPKVKMNNKFSNTHTTNSSSTLFNVNSASSSGTVSSSNSSTGYVGLRK